MIDMIRIRLLLCLAIFAFSDLAAQKEKSKSPYADIDFSAMKLRNVGPAFTSGRIADIAIHPNNDNVWYVAIGSGGVWKTENAGVTWKPIFDKQASYSTGCITIDASDPSIIWVGTGENVGGRHLYFFGAISHGYIRVSLDGKATAGQRDIQSANAA